MLAVEIDCALIETWLNAQCSIVRHSEGSHVYFVMLRIGFGHHAEVAHWQKSIKVLDTVFREPIEQGTKVCLGVVR